MATLQYDTRAWLKRHPEHVREFCDSYYDEAVRTECTALAGEVVGEVDRNCQWWDHNGIWTILGQRYESRAAHDRRMKEAGYITFDEVLKDWFTAEEIEEINAETERMLQDMKDEVARDDGRLQAANHMFWVPDSHEPGGTFHVAVPGCHAERLNRLHDYGYAGGRFPVRDYTQFFNELVVEKAITADEHRLLMRWVEYKSRPKLEREALEDQSAHRPVTDHPGVKQIRSLLSAFDDERDELEDSDMPSIILSRREAAEIIGLLKATAERDKEFRRMMDKLQGSLRPPDAPAEDDPIGNS